MDTIPRSRRQAHDSRSLANIWTAFTLLLLILSAFPALTDPAAAQAEVAEEETPAEAQPTETPVVEATQPPIAQPTEIPPAEPTQPPIAQPTEVPPAEPTIDSTIAATGTIVPEQQAPGVIEVTYWTCPPSIDLTVPDDRSVLTDSCVAQENGAEFELGSAGVASQTANTGNYGRSKVQFQNVPPGKQELSRVSPPEGVMAVFCSGKTSEGTARAYPYYYVTNSSIPVDLLPGEIFKCDWYATDPELENAELDTGSIRVIKRQCPVGFDPGAGLESDYSVPCRENAGQIDFRLEQTGSALPLQTTTSGNGPLDNEVNFVANAGPITISEVIPGGFGEPVVFCKAENPEFPITNVSVVDGNSIEWDLQAGQRLACAWFNVPLAGGDGGHFTVDKYICPRGATPENTWESYIATCTERAEGIEVTLDNAAGATTKATVDGYIRWEDAPAGPFTLTESIPPGYGEPAWWCESAGFYAGNTDLTIESIARVDAPGGVLSDSIDFDNPLYYSCSVFNIDEIGFSAIGVHKYHCPADTPENPDQESLSQECDVDTGGVEFTLTYGGKTVPQTTDADGLAAWWDVPVGAWELAEALEPGYREPLVYCRYLDPPADTPLNETLFPLEAEGGGVSGVLEYPDLKLLCFWANIPEDTTPVFVEKFNCPEGATPEETLESYQSQCTERVEGIEFTLDTALTSPVKSTNSVGAVEWRDVPVGPFTLTETVPPDYGDPVWWCASEFETEGSVRYGELIQVSHEKDAGEYYCKVFNIPEGPGDLTIYKWRCPAGYDPNEIGTDPKAGCIEPMNGVTFTLNQPADVDLQTNTGDSIPGAVTFGGIPAGSYVVTETVPDGIASAFVWDCVGTDIDSVHPTPLSAGNVLNIDVAGGDSIVCNWYNVPAYDPGYGQLTIHKYICAGPEFTAELNCEIYEHGAEFMVSGDSDDTVSEHSGTTDETGRLTLTNLNPGPYEVLEREDAWCHIVADGVGGDNKARVTAGEETIVKVYNCGQDTTTIGKPPAKYPNTGMAQHIYGNITGAEAGEEQNPILAGGTPTTGECPRLTLAMGTPADATPTLDDEAHTVSTPDATPGTTCERGTVPVAIEIEDAKVDAEIEVREVVDGVMQMPSAPEVVSWYKETARPGEAGNVVMAGHLNYWNVPEGVFFDIGELEPGDRIELKGEDGELYDYEVEWVEPVDASAPPTAEIVGPTEEESLTLITCGGEWNAEISEYNQRTVVRAVRVEVTEEVAKDS